MQSNRFILFMGIVLIVGGGLLLAGNLFHFDAWAFCWPVGLIALGAWFLFRPASRAAAGASTVRFIGDLRRQGAWQVVNEELTQFVGDVHLDLTQAVMAAGETHLSFSGFVGDIDLVVPPDVGVSVHSAAFVSEVRVLGQGRESIFAPVELSTPDYPTAEKQLKVNVAYFVADVRVKAGG